MSNVNGTDSLEPAELGKPSEHTPIEIKKPKVKAHKTTAAGLPAIFNSMRYVTGEAGALRGQRMLFRLNQKDGFDCPGCAWPDPDGHRSPTEYCENGAKAVAEEGTTLRADADFFRVHSVKELGTWSDYHIGKAGRLTHPMVLREGGTHYEPITWQGAFDLIASKLNALKSPDEAIFYTSGRTSNEAAFAYQLFAKLFGTNNLPDCSNMCHESSTAALTEAIGIGKGSVTLNDFDHADTILIMGQNPGTNHPRMLSTLLKCAQRGAKIISINPLFETGVNHFVHPQHFWRWFGPSEKIAALHLPIRLNSDIALLQGIMKDMLEFEEASPGTVFNREFIETKTDGFESFLAQLRLSSWDVICEQTGLTREHIRAASEIIAKSRSMIICWAMGITQQTEGVHVIREICNLLFLGGHFGRPGAGACPVRGHSNVQGDRTVGIWEKPTQVFLDRLEKHFAFKPPQDHGHDVVDSIRALHDDQAKVFFAMGGNFLSATPDTDFTAQALRRADLTVHVSTKPNRSHFVHGKTALILPALGRTEVDLQKSGEQFVTVEDSMSVVHASRGRLSPGQDQEKKSEVAIVCEMAKAVFHRQPAKASKVDWQAMMDNYDVIRDHIEATVDGFKDYNVRVREPGGFYLPHAVRDSTTFKTETQKGRFWAAVIPEIHLKPKQLLMMTIRSHDQFNTTIYGLNDRYRGIQNGRRVIFMNEADIREQGLAEGQWVDITSHWVSPKAGPGVTEETRVAPKFMVVKYDIPRRCAATYYPETNVLVPIDSVIAKSNTPTYKSIVITLKPAADTNTLSKSVASS